MVAVALPGRSARCVWLVPNPIGGNITRLGSLFGGPVLAADAARAADPRCRARSSVARAGAGARWQVITPLPDTLQSLGDPSTERSYYQPLNALARRPRRASASRIEIPYTFNHWETAYVSPRFALARGWLRQLDRDAQRALLRGRA